MKETSFTSSSSLPSSSSSSLSYFRESTSRRWGQVEVTKLIQPSEANPYGRLHGGNALKMLEEAGVVAATRHFNKDRGPNEPGKLAALVRMEKVDFLLPVHIGSVVDVDAELTFASERSLEVRIVMETSLMSSGDSGPKRALEAKAWFVPVYLEDGDIRVGRVPPLSLPSPALESGRLRYESQLRSRRDYTPSHAHPPVAIALAGSDLFDPYTVRGSQSHLSHHVNVNDCDLHRRMRGGGLMKLADEVAGIAAFRHSRRLCVTASVDAVNFNVPVQAGNVLMFDSYLTFTSPKSMEVEVVCHRGGLDLKTMEARIWNNVFNALYTFVCIDEGGRAVGVPGLKLETERERKTFEEGRKRYEKRMKERKKEEE